MDYEVAQYLVDWINDEGHGEATFYENYAGKGQCGRTTMAVRIDFYPNRQWREHLIDEIQTAHELGEIDISEEFLETITDTLTCTRIDNLGLEDFVMY